MPIMSTKGDTAWEASGIVQAGHASLVNLSKNGLLSHSRGRTSFERRDSDRQPHSYETKSSPLRGAMHCVQED
jgi:hypothetical protein